MIPKLYKPAKVSTPTMGKAITQQEIQFEVEVAKEEERGERSEERDVNEVKEERGKSREDGEEERELTALDKLKVWLEGLVKTVTE